MAYDFHGAWDKYSSSDAPLNIDPKRDPWRNNKDMKYYDITGIVDYLVDELHIKPSKLNMGIPLYGRGDAINGAGEHFGLY